MMGTEEQKGIIPQLNDDLWTRLNEKLDSLAGTKSDGSTKDNITAKFMVTVSFLEVYNEEIKDLLNPSDKKLKIHESPDQGIFVEGLCELVSEWLSIFILSSKIYSSHFKSIIDCT